MKLEKATSMSERFEKPLRKYSPRGLPLAVPPSVPLLQCRDCLCPADAYMVAHSVWRAAFRGQLVREGHLCFECLETRIERPLRLDDFMPDAPINRGILLGASLAKAKST